MGGSVCCSKRESRDRSSAIMCNVVGSMVKANSLFQQNHRIGFHGLFHLHSGSPLSEKYSDPSKLLEANGCSGKGQRGWKRRKTRFAWERRRDWIGCKDSVQCILESDRGAHHIVRSVHTQRPSVFIPNGHQLQFSSDAHFGISIHP